MKQADPDITAVSHSLQISTALFSFFYDQFTVSLSDDAPPIPTQPHSILHALLKAALIWPEWTWKWQ